MELVGRVSRGLEGAGLMLAVAESCTGGLLAARITDLPGASVVLAGGVVVYSDEAKVRILGVRPATIVAQGAVSEAAAREMLEGVRTRFGTKAGVAVTGIAGPGGATAGKPVGTVWIAAAADAADAARRYRFDGDRTAVREAAVEAALEMLAGLLETAP